MNPHHPPTITTSAAVSEAAASFEETAKRYFVELEETYLFPSLEHSEKIRRIAAAYGFPEPKVRADFEIRRPMGEWLKVFWARMLVPTAPKFDDVTPILARVRHGCATDREFDWLGQRLALAVQMDEHEFLKLAVKLATQPLKVKAPHLMSIAAFDYFDEHGEIPSFTELRDYVQHSIGEKTEKYEALSDENWTRHLRLSGVSFLSSDPQ